MDDRGNSNVYRKYDESYQLRREIDYLKETLSDRDDEIRDLEKKIKHDGPIVSNPELKRCTSEYCGDCKYAIKSVYDERPLRCCKNVVCEDFRI